MRKTLDEPSQMLYRFFIEGDALSRKSAIEKLTWSQVNDMFVEFMKTEPGLETRRNAVPIMKGISVNEGERE